MAVYFIAGSPIGLEDLLAGFASGFRELRVAE